MITIQGETMRWMNIVLLVIVVVLITSCADSNTARRETDNFVTEITVDEPVPEGDYLIYNWHGTFTNTSDTDTLMFEAKTNQFDEYVEWPPYVIEFVLMPEDASENPIDVHGASFSLVGPFKYDKTITHRTVEELIEIKQNEPEWRQGVFDYDEKIEWIRGLTSALRQEDGGRYEEEDLLFELVDGRVRMTIPTWLIMAGKTISVRGYTKILSADQVLLERWDPLPRALAPYREDIFSRPEWLKVDYRL